MALAPAHDLGGRAFRLAQRVVDADVAQHALFVADRDGHAVAFPDREGFIQIRLAPEVRKRTHAEFVQCFPRPAAPPGKLAHHGVGNRLHDAEHVFRDFAGELHVQPSPELPGRFARRWGKSFLRILTLECTQPFRRTFGVALDLAPEVDKVAGVRAARKALEDVVRHVVAERHGAVVVERTQAVEPVAVFLLHDKERPRDAVAGFRREVVLRPAHYSPHPSGIGGHVAPSGTLTQREGLKHLQFMPQDEAAKRAFMRAQSSSACSAIQRSASESGPDGEAAVTTGTGFAFVGFFFAGFGAMTVGFGSSNDGARRYSPLAIFQTCAQ